MQDGEVCLGVTISEMNFSAEDLEDEDATAATVWTMSCTSRIEGVMRRSLAKVRAMLPVARRRVSQACALAAAAQVKHLILFHHDPERTDDEIDAIQDMARAWLQTQDQPVQCTAAYEGLVVQL